MLKNVVYPNLWHFYFRILPNLALLSRVATVRKTILENEKIPGQGKVREFHFQSGKFKKKMKKVREFQKAAS